MSGQIVDASLEKAPKQRNTDVEKEAIKAGKTAREIWSDEPRKAAQKDTDARWTLKIGGKIRYRLDGTPLPVFGYKSHIAIDRRFGFIRESALTSASHVDGRVLPRLVTTDNTSSEVSADIKDAGQPYPSAQVGGQADAAEYRAGRSEPRPGHYRLQFRPPRFP